MQRIFQHCEKCFSNRHNLKFLPGANCRCIWLKEIYPKPLRRESVLAVIAALQAPMEEENKNEST